MKNKKIIFVCALFVAMLAFGLSKVKLKADEISLDPLSENTYSSIYNLQQFDMIIRPSGETTDYAMFTFSETMTFLDLGVPNLGFNYEVIPEIGPYLETDYFSIGNTETELFGTFNFKYYGKIDKPRFNFLFTNFVIPKSLFEGSFRTGVITLSDLKQNVNINYNLEIYRSNRFGPDKQFYFDTFEFDYLDYSSNDFFIFPTDNDVIPNILANDLYGNNYLFVKSLFISVEYDNLNTDALTSFQIESQLINNNDKGNFLTWENDFVYTSSFSPVAWLADSVGAFLDTPLLGSAISIGDILLIVVCIPLVIALLKYFAGG